MDYPTLAQQFAHPPAAYRPMVFWLWNGDITREGIEEQIADFAAQGCGGFFFHPMGESFRLRDFLQGMTPAYLSDEFFALIRHAVATAHEYGLYAWLYDEGGWPSGTAQGEVVDGHPEFRGKRLHARRVRSLELPSLPDNVVAAVGVPEIGVAKPLDLRELAEGLWSYDELIIFSVEDDGFPVDILNPQAVARFIEVTHERYAECVGEYFGTTIPGIFTDETSLGGRLGGDGIPWFSGLLEMLTERMGRDARTYLPLLFPASQIGEEVLRRYSDHEVVAARCDYYNELTRRFGESYWQQISAWCADHGLIHTGHVGGEDNLPDHLSFGHFFRTAGALHLPGVDVIWRQLFPGQEVFPFPRLASSAMKQSDSGVGAGEEGPWAHGVLTETNAVYGFGLHFGQMRWLLDVQAQHGVNLYAPMASYYTTEGGRLYGTMSHCGPGNPLWPHYRAFATYVGRLCLLARQGAEPARVAVYYPVEALWSLEGTQEAWESLQVICRTLTQAHLPFDFVDADLLQSLQVEVGSGTRGDLAYDRFIVPAVLTMPATAVEKLAELREAAAEVTVVDHWPLNASEMTGSETFQLAVTRLQEAGARPVAADDLPATLTSLAPLEYEVLAGGKDLLVSSRLVDSVRFYLLTNNSPRTSEPVLAFDPGGPGRLEGWNLRDGGIVPLDWHEAVHPQGFQALLPPWSTEVVAVRPLELDQTAAVSEVPEEALALQRWLADPQHRNTAVPPADVVAEFEQADRAEVVRQYLVQNGTVRLAPYDELETVYGGQPVPLWDWSDWPMPDFSGEVRYEFEMVVADELIHQPLLLDLGEVFWVASVELNGEHVGDLLWGPYVLDVSGLVRAGSNRLVITVANTLANQACRPEVEAEARANGWCNAYLERALPMMREDLRSGLVGPVRLLVSR